MEEELEKIKKSLAKHRARRQREKGKYREKYPEKLAEQRKRYREQNRDKIAEAKKNNTMKPIGNKSVRIKNNIMRHIEKNVWSITKDTMRHIKKNVGSISEDTKNRFMTNVGSITKKRYQEQNDDDDLKVERRRKMKAMNQKRYRDRNLERCREYHRQYYQTHRKSCHKRRNNHREATRQFMVEYQEKRDNTFGMTLQRQLDYFHSEKKRTEEKLKAIGPQKLKVTLTDYLKSPPPPPSMNQCTPIITYLETFCQSLNEDEEEEENVSFMHLLNGPTMLNLDSHQIHTMDQHVWDEDTETEDSFLCDKDVTEWLDGLMAYLEEEEPCSLENTVDVENLIDDMNADDWEHVIDDVRMKFLTYLQL